MTSAFASHVVDAMPSPRSLLVSCTPGRPGPSRLAAVSHDLKDPLAAIEMALDFALDEELGLGAAALPDAAAAIVRRQLAAARRAAQRMRRVIASTLDDALDAAPVLDTAATTLVSPEALLEEIVEQYGAAAHAADVALVQECSGPLPLLRVQSDAVLRALGNLIGNAIKFTPAGGRVTVRASADAAMVTFVVADTGPGVPPAAGQHLFRRFWQAPETAHLGSGAGLLITRMLVEEEGGTVTLQESDGPGAEFHVALPVAPRLALPDAA